SASSAEVLSRKSLMSYFSPYFSSMLGRAIRSAPSAPIWMPWRTVSPARTGVDASPPAPIAASARDESQNLRRVIRGAVIQSPLVAARPLCPPREQERPSSTLVERRQDRPCERNAPAL